MLTVNSGSRSGDSGLGRISNEASTPLQIGRDYLSVTDDLNVASVKHKKRGGLFSISALSSLNPAQHVAPFCKAIIFFFFAV